MTTEGKGFTFKVYYTLVEFINDEGDYDIKEIHFDTIDEAIDCATRNCLERWQVLETKVVTTKWKEPL
jgi:hypothetical protein